MFNIFDLYTFCLFFFQRFLIAEHLIITCRTKLESDPEWCRALQSWLFSFGHSNNYQHQNVSSATSSIVWVDLGYSSWREDGSQIISHRGTCRNTAGKRLRQTNTKDNSIRASSPSLISTSPS